METPPEPSPWPLRLRLIALAAAVLTLGNALWAAWDQDITYDEPFHVGWAERLLDSRIDTREQFRFDSKTPALIPGVLLRKAARQAGIESEQALRFATRLPSVALLALTLMMVAHLSRTSAPRTQWIGLLLAALDANLAANASLATTDLAYTLVVLLFAVAIARRCAWLPYGACIGALLGLALAVKYTALLLVPVGILFIVARAGDKAARRLLSLAAAALVACLAASLFYLGVGIFEPLGSIPLQVQRLNSIAALAPSLPVPLPRSILTGIDASMAHNQPGLWASYIFGADHPGGVWYYFAANWLMKTPVALVLITLVGFWGLRPEWRNRATVAMAILFSLHLAYLSFFFATQIGLRFALPCIALACALAARGLGTVNPRWLVLVAALAALERAPYWGDPIAFTNVAVPKNKAYRYTADSNLDYGQNRQRVARYARETGLAYVMNQPMITPGLFVASANDLVIFDSRRSLRWLVESGRPVTRVGFTHFAFSVSGESFEEYMNAYRMAAPPSARDTVCDPPLAHYPPGAKIPFEQSVSPGDGRLWAVCVWSRKGVDIGFTVTSGRLFYGRITSSGECEADLLQQGQQAWFRVPRETGVRLCLREIPYRRASLPYFTSGYLTVRGQGADVEVRGAGQ